MHFEVSRNIARSPEFVWPLLTDKSVLLGGGFGILKIEGEIGPQERIKVWSEVSPGRAFALTVSTFAQPREMVWESGMPLGLFKGVRRFTLDPVAGGCQFRMREEFTGALVGLIGRSIPDLAPSFDKFADALKRAAEGKN